MQRGKNKRMTLATLEKEKPPSSTLAPANNAKQVRCVGVVEDDTGLRRNLVRIITAAPGLRCIGSWPDGASALNALPDLKPDVVLMDINLPGMSGVECTARLKLVCPETQVIIVTVYNDSENIFNALKVGACGYLLKRTSSAGIVEAITEVLNGGAPMSGEIARKLVGAFQTAPAKSATGSELSPREREILRLMAQGSTDKKIAADLNLSYHTVKVHARSIYEKLHIHSRAEAVMKYASDVRLSIGDKNPESM